MVGNRCENSWDITEVDNVLNQELLKDFLGERSGFIQVGPKKYVFPSKFAEEAGNFYNFKPRKDDVWVATFPRSGTTWTQEMVWLLANDMNFKKAEEIALAERFPFLEFSACVNNERKAEWMDGLKLEPKKQEILEKVCGPVTGVLQQMTGQRFIKTHLPFSLLPPDLTTCGAKIVYVARNPKDVAVSYYHLHKLIKTLDFVGNFHKFWDYFERNLLLWSPYWAHIEEGWKLRNNPNVLFMFYEDIKKDTKSAIQKVAEFLPRQYNDERISDLVDHLNITKFRMNSSVNAEEFDDIGLYNDYEHRYVRKGESGAWKDLFSKELNERADRWIEKNLENVDFRFPINL